ncbi:MAG: hypothetical protein LBD60_00220 [Puniceicoccales bacterium]|jgi:hypothetical protein|nr:hypothetical protein [Puniceicoccales bacterium]
MRDAVLKHSYPFGLDQPLDFTNNKEQAIANLISIVDAMGVTANTKCPALYREILTPEIMQELAMDDGPEIRKNLHAIIDQAVTERRISREVAEGYHMALDYDVSKYGAKNMILPQFGGQLLETHMEQVEGGHALHIRFGVSEDIRILAGLFGNGDEVKAFNKAGEDLFPDVPKGELGKAASEVEKSLKPYAARTLSSGAVKLTLTKLQE